MLIKKSYRHYLVKGNTHINLPAPIVIYVCKPAQWQHPDHNTHNKCNRGSCQGTADRMRSLVEEMGFNCCFDVVEMHQSYEIGQ